MQQQLMQQQPNISNITTDHIQQCLDENKALILKILENQNAGKYGEFAENQTRFQRNLMYLAAIADCSQPKPTPTYLQPLMNSTQHQQLQSQQMVHHSHLTAQSPMAFAQQHHALQSQLGISSAGTSGVHTPPSQACEGFPDFGQTIFGQSSQGMSRLGNTSRTHDYKSTTSAQDGGDNPQKKGKFNRETT